MPFRSRCFPDPVVAEVGRGVTVRLAEAVSFTAHLAKPAPTLPSPRSCCPQSAGRPSYPQIRPDPTGRPPRRRTLTHDISHRSRRQRPSAPSRRPERRPAHRQREQRSTAAGFGIRANDAQLRADNSALSRQPGPDRGARPVTPEIGRRFRSRLVGAFTGTLDVATEAAPDRRARVRGRSGPVVSRPSRRRPGGRCRSGDPGSGRRHRALHRGDRRPSGTQHRPRRRSVQQLRTGAHFTSSRATGRARSRHRPGRARSHPLRTHGLFALGRTQGRALHQSAADGAGHPWAARTPAAAVTTTALNDLARAHAADTTQGRADPG